METAKIDRIQAEHILANLEAPVKFVLFMPDLASPQATEIRETLSELTTITRKLELEIYNFATDKEKVTQYNITRAPAIVPISRKDFGLRYYGTPLRMAFPCFLENLVDISRGKTHLSEAHRDRLRGLNDPLHVQLFSHGDCPFGLPIMHYLGRFVVECALLSVDFIDVLAFPDLIQTYQIHGVPFAVINEELRFYAAVSEDEFLSQLEKAVS